MSLKNTTEYFYKLTPDKIHQALERAGLETEPTLRWLNSLENRVVSLTDVEGERWVAKFYRPGRWSYEALEEEHDFLYELFDAGLPVRPPLELDDGDTIGQVEGIYFAVFPHQYGRMPDEITWEHLEVLGSLVARLHKVGRRDRTEHRPTVSPADWGMASLKTLEYEKVVPEVMWPRYRATAVDLVNRVEDLFTDFPFQRIHGDLHRGNILWSSQGPELVDFDDLTMGPVIQDLWMLIPGRDEEALQMRQVFLESYERIMPFDRDQMRLVEPLRALKFLRHAAWVAKRRKDPAFVRLYPEVEGHRFWRRELEDLQNQLQFLAER